MLTTTDISAPTESQPTPVEAEAGREAPPIHDEHDDGPDFEIVEGERLYRQSAIDRMVSRRLARQQRAHERQLAEIEARHKDTFQAALKDAIDYALATRK